MAPLASPFLLAFVALLAPSSLAQSPPSFAAPVVVPVGAAPQGLALGEFNGDENLDLVSADSGAGTVTWRLGDGIGGFPSAHSAPVEIEPVDVEVADLDGDGGADLVVANYSSGSLSVLLSDGNGGFAPQTSFADGSQPAAIAFGDVNDDGALDVAVAHYLNPGYATVLIGDGLGGLAAPTFIPIASDRPVEAALRDLDGDGAVELLVVSAHASASFLSVLK